MKIRFRRHSEIVLWYTIFIDDKEIGMVKKKRFRRGRYWVAEDKSYFFLISGAKTRKSAVRALLVLMGLE